MLWIENVKVYDLKESVIAAENILRRGISELWSGSKTVSNTASRACTQESHVL